MNLALRTQRTGPLTEIGLLVVGLSLPLWAMTPTDIFDRFGAIKFQVVMLVAIGIALTFGLRAIAAGGFSLTYSPALILGGLLIVQSVTAALLSTSPVVGVWGNNMRYDGFLMILANAVLALLAYRLVFTSGTRAVDLAAKATVLASIPVSLYAFLQAAGIDPFVWEPWRTGSHRAFSTLGNPIFLGAFAAMAMALAVAVGVGTRGRSRFFWATAAGLNLAAVTVSAARASWLAAGASLLLLGAYSLRNGMGKRYSWQLAVTGLVAVVVVVAGVQLSAGASKPILLNSADTIANPAASRNSGRLATWAIALRVIRDHPVVGVGPDEFGLVFPAYRTAAFDRAEGTGVIADKPHSLLLQWAVETGIPGAVLFVALCGTVLVSSGRRLLRRVGSPGSGIVIAGVWIAGATYLAQALITVTAIGVNGVWWVCLGLLAGVSAAAGRRATAGTAHVASPSVVRSPRSARRAELAGQSGFTLIELLVVIIIIAILAAIAIPTFLGQRQKAQDAAAMSLVRNSLTIITAQLVGTGTFSGLAAASLQAEEPSIRWTMCSSDLVDPSVPLVTDAVTALAGRHEVDVYVQSATICDLGTMSNSGNRYGIQVQTDGSAGATYVKVKTADGVRSTSW